MDIKRNSYYNISCEDLGHDTLIKYNSSYSLCHNNVYVWGGPVAKDPQRKQITFNINIENGKP